MGEGFRNVGALPRHGPCSPITINPTFLPISGSTTCACPKPARPRPIWRLPLASTGSAVTTTGSTAAGCCSGVSKTCWLQESLTFPSASAGPMRIGQDAGTAPTMKSFWRRSTTSRTTATTSNLCCLPSGTPATSSSKADRFFLSTAPAPCQSRPVRQTYGDPSPAAMASTGSTSCRSNQRRAKFATPKPSDSMPPWNSSPAGRCWPPSATKTPAFEKVKGFIKNESPGEKIHRVVDHQKACEAALSRPIPPYPHFPCVTPSWD